MTRPTTTSGELRRLSIVVPAHNEEGAIESTVRGLGSAMTSAGIDHEIVVVDDRSTDRTGAILATLASDVPELVIVRAGEAGGGFGLAVQAGLDAFTGDAVAIVMADGSDAPDDVVRYWRVLQSGFDCAFGSRFMAGSEVVGYPRIKLLANRIVNLGIRALFRHGYNDTTNAFKAYRREVIDALRPLLSHHFNLTVELPLKAVVRGFSYEVVPISWTDRSSGESKLRLQEMGSRYLFIVLYVLLEHLLSRGDYRRPGLRDASSRQLREMASQPRDAASS